MGTVSGSGDAALLPARLSVLFDDTDVFHQKACSFTHGTKRGLQRCPPAEERVWEEGNSAAEFQLVPIDGSASLRVCVHTSAHSNDRRK